MAGSRIEDRWCICRWYAVPFCPVGAHALVARRYTGLERDEIQRSEVAATSALAAIGPLARAVVGNDPERIAAFCVTAHREDWERRGQEESPGFEALLHNAVRWFVINRPWVLEGGHAA